MIITAIFFFFKCHDWPLGHANNALNHRAAPSSLSPVLHNFQVFSEGVPGLRSHSSPSRGSLHSKRSMRGRFTPCKDYLHVGNSTIRLENVNKVKQTTCISVAPCNLDARATQKWRRNFSVEAILADVHGMEPWDGIVLQSLINSAVVTSRSKFSEGELTVKVHGSTQYQSLVIRGN